MPDDFSFDNVDDLGGNLDSDMFAEQKPKVNIMAKIKPHIGTIVKILVLILILFAAYYFFFLRYVTVSFDVVNYAIPGGSPETTTITLTNGKSINVDTGDNIRLLPGSYDVSINDPNLDNYYLYTKSITIDKSDDKSTKTIELYPSWFQNIDSIKIVKNSIPKLIYKNQDVSFQANIKYSGKGDSIDLIIELDENQVAEKSVDLKTGENIVDLSFKNYVDKQDKNVHVKVIIDKTNNIYSTSFEVPVKKPPKFTINTKDSYEVHAGNNLKMVFELNNSTKYKIPNINFSIISANQDPAIIKSWIQKIPKNLTISPGINTVNVDFNIPLLKDPKDKTITVDFSNSFLSVTKDITIKILPANIELPKSLDLGQMTAGTTITKNIVITNNTNYPLEIDSNANIDITKSSSTNSLPQLQNMFIIDLPEELQIGDTSIPIIVVLNPNLQSDNVKGNITIKTTNGLDLTIPFSINITGIEDKLDIGLQDSYTFKFNDKGQLESKNHPIAITIKNTGNIDLNIVDISLDQKCKILANLNTKEMIGNPFILKTLSDPLKIYLIPIATSNLFKSTSSYICLLKVTYTDPHNKSQPKTISKSFTITSDIPSS